MGTDIHIVAQIKDEILGAWVDFDGGSKEAWDSITGRSYSWFTFLDGTRARLTNDERNEGVVPIFEPRGAPDDFEIRNEEVDSYHGDVWMGYGVSSWATLREILEGVARQPKSLPWLVRSVAALCEIFNKRSPDACRIVFGYDS